MNLINFHFFQEWPEIKQECTNAETHVYKQPRFAVILCRGVFEKMLHSIKKNQKAQAEQSIEKAEELLYSLLGRAFKGELM